MASHGSDSNNTVQVKIMKRTNGKLNRDSQEIFV